MHKGDVPLVLMLPGICILIDEFNAMLLFVLKLMDSVIPEDTILLSLPMLTFDRMLAEGVSDREPDYIM